MVHQIWLLLLYPVAEVGNIANSQVWKILGTLLPSHESRLSISLFVLLRYSHDSVYNFDS